MKIGTKFNSKWVANGVNEITVLDINEEENTLSVSIKTDSSEWVENDWNLEHTKWGFNRMDYKLISK